MPVAKITLNFIDTPETKFTPLRRVYFSEFLDKTKNITRISSHRPTILQNTPDKGLPVNNDGQKIIMTLVNEESKIICQVPLAETEIIKGRAFDCDLRGIDWQRSYVTNNSNTDYTNSSIYLTINYN